MKIAVLVARILLGLIFVFFGLNGFLNFLHAPMPAGGAGQYMALLGPTIYMQFVFLVQTRRRSAPALRPVHPARPGIAWSGDCQHPVVSHNPAACRPATRAVCCRLVVHYFLWRAEVFRWCFRVEGGDLKRELLIPGLKIETWATPRLAVGRGLKAAFIQLRILGLATV